MPEFLTVESDAQVEAVVRMAREIWYEHYVPLIGRAQVDYMVAKFQSAAAVRQQMREGYRYFMVHRARQAGSQEAAQEQGAAIGYPIGYLAVQARPAEGAMFISKLYLHREARGAGTGRACLAFIERLARREGVGLLWLTVNKGNPAIQAYERAGFRIARPIVTDIGNGFVMDDFRMEKTV